MAASAHYIVLKEVEKVRSYSFNHCAYSLLRIATPHLYQQTILPKWPGLNESGNIAISDIQIASFMCVSCCLLLDTGNQNSGKNGHKTSIFM